MWSIQTWTSTSSSPAAEATPTTVLDKLYVLQSRAVNPQQRRRHIRAFEKRLLDEEAHYIYTLQWNRIVPHSSRVRGWTITPSHYLNNQLDVVWLEN